MGARNLAAGDRDESDGVMMTTRTVVANPVVLWVAAVLAVVLPAWGTASSARPNGSVAPAHASPTRSARPPSNGTAWRRAWETSSAELVHVTSGGRYTSSGVSVSTTRHTAETFDPLKHEVRQQNATAVAAGSARSATVTSEGVAIGSPPWVKSTPPGGAW